MIKNKEEDHCDGGSSYRRDPEVQSEDKAAEKGAGRYVESL